mgnify:CR=1 FL=1
MSINSYILMLTRYVDLGNEVLNGIFVSCIIMCVPLFVNYFTLYAPIIKKWIIDLIYGKGASVYYYYQSSASPENCTEYEEIKSLIWYLRKHNKFDDVDLQKMDNQFLPFRTNYISIDLSNKKYRILFNIQKNKTDNKDAVDESLLIGSVCITCVDGKISDVQDLIKYVFDSHKDHLNKQTWKLEFFSYNKRRRLFSLDEKSNWCSIDSPFESIVLPIKIENEFMKKINSFLDSEDNYTKNNIPYKRIIYLNGKPGTGKTSLAIMVARYLKRNIYTIKLNEITSDELLSNIFCSIRSTKGIILIEEFDCCPQVTNRKILKENHSNETNSNKDSTDDKSKCFTLGTLLSEMDGMRPWNGEIIFITTNHMEEIDPALLRPGRCDYVMNYDNMSSEDICRLIYKRTDKEVSSDKLHEIPDKKYSPAEIQGKIIDNINDYDGLMKDICN